VAWQQLTDWARPWPEEPDLQVCLGRDEDRVLVVQHRQGTETYDFLTLSPMIRGQSGDLLRSAGSSPPPEEVIPLPRHQEPTHQGGKRAARWTFRVIGVLVLLAVIYAMWWSFPVKPI
jgi:hypothetical protein